MAVVRALATIFICNMYGMHTHEQGIRCIQVEIETMVLAKDL
jgi:hypothetical protein